MTQVAPLLAVRDVERSVSFYRRLGFIPVTQWATYAKLSAGDGQVLHLAAQGDAPADRPTVAMAAPAPVSGTASAIVVLQVDDCEQACAKLQETGVELLAGPAVPPWGGEARAFLRDPDGHLIEINEPRGDADPLP